MPAQGPGEAPPVVVRRARRVRRQQQRASRPAPQRGLGQAHERPAPRPSVPVSAAQRPGVRPLSPKPVRPKPVRVVRAAPAGDTKGDVHAGEDFKRRAQYRGSVRAAYDQLPVHERRQRVAQAVRRVEHGVATPEDAVVLHEHVTRIAGKQRVARAGAAFRALGGPTTAQLLGESERFTGPKAIGGTGPTVRARKANVSIGDKIAGAIRAVGKASSQGYASVHAPRLIRNVPKDLAELAVTTPSSIAKLGSDVVHHPGRVPGELVQPYAQLAKDPGKFVTEHPATALLMVAPGVRAPGRAAGRVARLAGKQTLERPAAVLEGSNLRQARTGSRDIVVRAVQSAVDKRRGTPTISDREVRRRVDEHFGAGQQYVRRVTAAAGREARQRGMTPDQAAEHISGARGGAQNVLDQRFEEEFGPNVPEVATKRLAYHSKVGKTQATPAVALRVTRRAMTKAVLPVSPKWLTGNVVEAAVRSLVSGAGPTSYLRAGRVVRELERQSPGAGKRLLERAAPGGLIGTAAAHEMSTRTLGEEFAATELAKLAGALTKAGKAPGIRHIREGHAAFTSIVFNSVNGRLEGATQRAMLGRALARSPLMERRVIGLSDKAIKDAAKGLHATEAQVQLAREVQRSFGKYANLSPGLRSFVQHWTPFILWHLNVARFLAHTLPVEHPLHAAMLADASAAEEEWRKAQGLSLRSKDHKPGYLLGSYPVGTKGQVVRVGQFLPFESSDPAGTIASLLLPQFAGAYHALQGQDWKGDPLHGKFGPDATQAQRAVAAANELLESMVPGVAQSRSIRDRGLNATFNPLAPTKPPKVKRKGATAVPLNPLLKPVKVKPVKVLPLG